MKMTNVFFSAAAALLTVCAVSCGSTEKVGSSEGAIELETAVNGGNICAAYIATWGVYDPVKKRDRAWKADDIEGDKLTDLILSFAEVNDKDHVSLDTGDVESCYGEVKKLVQKYPHLRVSVAIGGASDGIADFKAIAADSSLRTKFIDNVKALLTGNTDIHGIDIDWEYPGKRLKYGTDEWEKEFSAYITLLKELKLMMLRLGKSNGIAYRLTTALPADNGPIINESSRIQEVCDGLNIMMYDFCGSWSSNTGHNAPVDEVESDLQRYLGAGTDPDKLILGIPFYGQRWTGIEEEEDNHGLGSNVPKQSGDGGYEFSKILKRLEDSNYVRYFDEYAESPYLYNAKDKIFISYTGADAVTRLTQLVRDYKLGGAMTWEYGQDMTGTLLKAMYSGLSGK